MAISTTLIDTENFDWDFQSDRGLIVLGESEIGLAIIDGEADTFDSGLMLRVNGTAFNPDRATVDFNGRELNTQALLVGDIAVARSILVSDAGISATGFARFLDSFTNTSDTEQTITVDIALNSGADAGILIPRTSSGDGTLTASDTGFVLDDLNTTGADSALAYVYGDGNSAFGFPSAASQVGDAVAITYTLTLAPGQTRSLLSFATQSVTAAEAITDLARFDADAIALNTGGFLAGLSRAEQLTVANYTGFDRLQAPFTLVDADGHSWGIDTAGRLSSLDTTALTRFQIPILAQNFDTFQGFLVDDVAGEVTVVTSGFETVPDSTVSYTYRALEDEGVIRLLVTWTGGSGGIGNVTLDPTVTTGANPALLPNTVTVPTGPAVSFTSGVLLDDSESGSGGVLPALSYMFGATGIDNSSSIAGPTFASVMPGQGVGIGEVREYLFFFALNGDALGGLTDLNRLNTPGPEALAGLSDLDIARIQNFELTSADRLDSLTGTSADDVLTGNAWGDKINGAQGNDEITGGASDDVLQGGLGRDLLDGGAGADSVDGGSGNDQVLGGTGADLLRGGIGNDQIFGGGDNDRLFGGDNNDKLFGGNGDDSLVGDAGIDRLDGDTGNDVLTGGADRDFFVFATGFGDDRITDFLDRTDRIDFSGNTTANVFADLAITQVGADALITLTDGDTVLINNLEIRFLTAADFIF